MKHEHFMTVAKIYFVVVVTVLGILALTAAFTGCWAGKPDVRVVYKVRYVHDEPRSCRKLDAAETAEARDHALSMFPSLLDVGKPEFVEKLGHWVTAAGMCLGYEVYDVSWYLRPVSREDGP